MATSPTWTASTGRPTAAELIRNGNIVQGLDKPTNGQFTPLHIYYNPNPAKRDFTEPNGFSQGQFIGRFRSRAAVVNAVAPGSFASTAGLTLGSSSDFIYNGRTINFLSRANGLSLTLFGPAPSFESITQQLLSSGYVYIPLPGTGYVAHSGNRRLRRPRHPPLHHSDRQHRVRD